jgi:lipopolysaccharide/colanic/teichoic acid biosynthesis glycosyltransferase
MKINMLKKLKFKNINHNSIKKRNGIHPVEDFWVMLERERARVDRNNHQFSVVTFEIHNSYGDSEQTYLLIHVLSKRARSSDLIGWLNHRQVGVFLPDTPISGACKFAADIFQTSPANNFTAKYTVFSYPSGKFAEEEKKTNYPKVDDMNHVNDDQHFWGVPSNTVTDIVAPTSVVKKQLNNQKAEKSVENVLEKCFSRKLPTWKRSMDIIGSVIGLFLLSPIFLIIAAFIKVVSPGPVFYKQERIGYQGKKFKFWKFRTMKVNSDTQIHRQHLHTLINNEIPMEKLDTEQDPRIIPFGKFLRQSCLDELPQLINVFRGEMSLVGPRPCLAYEAEQYNLWHTRRFDVTPGMTGYWQVNGKNRTTFREMIRLDILYARQMSFGFDIKILLKTIPSIISQILINITNERTTNDG